MAGIPIAIAFIHIKTHITPAIATRTINAVVTTIINLLGKVLKNYFEYF